MESPAVRILFTGVVGFGHFNPMVPLARAFADAGHEVRFAIDPGFCPTVEATGFTAFPAGLNHREALARFRATMPGWDAIPPADRAIHLVPGMFGRVRVPPMLADLGPIIERWRPGLLIHDSAELAGGIAAEASGIPHVEHSFGLLRPLAVRQAATDVLGPLSAAAGVRNPGVGGLADEPYLDICPPRLQFADIAALPIVIRLRSVEIQEPADPRFDAWLTGRDGRPVVYLTLGTVFNDVDLVRSILDAIEEADVDIVVTLGPGSDPSILGDRPGHVHVASFIPQAQVLRRTRVMISHAGSGALLGAIAAGVPILAIPQGADQFMNAGRIVEAGLGLRILPDELAPDVIRTRLSTLLDDARFAEAAHALRRDLESMPSPGEVVDQLVQLAG